MSYFSTSDKTPSPLAGEGWGEGEMNSTYVKFARVLRKNSTEAERKLWGNLRAKRLAGFKFKRQQVIGKYIVDFICFEKRVIVEMDGGQHAVNVKEDTIRDNWLKGQGFSILRFWNNEVLTNIDGVVAVIHDACSGKK